MNEQKLAIATISLTRTGDEENALRTSLTQLTSLGYPVFITDGGSPASFQYFLHSLPQVTVFSQKGLWPQAKASITAARDAGGHHDTLYGTG